MTLSRPSFQLAIVLAIVAAGALAACEAAGPDEAAPLDVSEAALGVGSYTFGALGGTTKCLDVSGSASADGTRIQEWTCNGTGAQSFRVETLAAGGVRLVSSATGKCVDVAGGATADRTSIQEWTCNGTGAQSFRLDDAGSGNVRIVHPASGKCVDVEAAASADGTRVQLYTCNGTGAQLWRSTARVQPLRIMPLGASITWGVGGTHAGYRNPLGNLLNEHGIAH